MVLIFQRYKAHEKRSRKWERSIVLPLSPSFRLCSFELRLFPTKRYTIACSPNAMAWMDLCRLGMEGTTTAAVEIKTRAASSTIERALHHVSNDVATCVAGEYFSKNMIPQKRCGQILQQSLALSVDFVVHVSSSEIQLLEICASHVPFFVREEWLLVLFESLSSVVRWAHIRT